MRYLLIFVGEGWGLVLLDSPGIHGAEIKLLNGLLSHLGLSILFPSLFRLLGEFHSCG